MCASLGGVRGHLATPSWVKQEAGLVNNWKGRHGGAALMACGRPYEQSRRGVAGRWLQSGGFNKSRRRLQGGCGKADAQSRRAKIMRNRQHPCEWAQPAGVCGSQGLSDGRRTVTVKVPLALLPDESVAVHVTCGTGRGGQGGSNRHHDLGRQAMKSRSPAFSPQHDPATSVPSHPPRQAANAAG